MNIRVGRVTNVYPSEGKVKVLYEDTDNVSMPLSLLTMNNEYSMPEVGDRVLTLHMPNGSSKGFVLGTYYGGSNKPLADDGYRKDFGRGAYISRTKEGAITIHSENDITLSCASGSITLSEIIEKLKS